MQSEADIREVLPRSAQIMALRLDKEEKTRRRLQDVN